MEKTITKSKSPPSPGMGILPTHFHTFFTTYASPAIDVNMCIHAKLSTSIGLPAAKHH